jgi:hypothetical protein
VSVCVYIGLNLWVKSSVVDGVCVCVYVCVCLCVCVSSDFRHSALCFGDLGFKVLGVRV